MRTCKTKSRVHRFGRDQKMYFFASCLSFRVQKYLPETCVTEKNAPFLPFQFDRHSVYFGSTPTERGRGSMLNWCTWVGGPILSLGWGSALKNTERTARLRARASCGSTRPYIRTFVVAVPSLVIVQFRSTFHRNSFRAGPLVLFSGRSVRWVSA